MMKQNKIYVIDNVIIGNNHIVNNAGILGVLDALFEKSVEIKFFSDKSHALNVETRLTHDTKQRVQFHAVRVIDPVGGIFKKLILWLEKLREDKRFITEVLNQAIADKPKLIYFCTLIPANIYRFLRIFSNYPQQRIIIGLHGEIEFLFRTEQSAKNKLNADFYKKAFRKVPKNVKFSVLSSVIRDKLIERGFLREDQVIWMEHPIQMTDNAKESVFPSVPIFSYLGVASARKNGKAFFDLVNQVQSPLHCAPVRFDMVGKVSPELLPYRPDAIHWVAENNQSIPQADYVRYCNMSTYALSFLNGEEYIFRISGSLMDAIQYHIPLIALKHDYVNYLFRQGGDIGFLCENLNEMLEVVMGIQNKDKELTDRYEIQVANMKKLATGFYDKHNVMNLRKNLENIGWRALAE